MERFLWTKYKKGDITDKIIYWVDLWEDLIDNFKSRSIGFKIISPTSLLNEIQDEIIYNKLRNNSNVDYYKRQLNFFLKEDLVIKKHFSSDFKLLLKEFENKRLTYFSGLCNKVKNQLKKDKYFHKSWNELRNILLNEVWDREDKSNIELISKNLIVELILIGYSLDTIRNLPTKIFSLYQKHGNLIITDYPYKTNDEKSDYSALKNELDNLKIKDRLDRFIYFYTKKRTKAFFIFQVEGLIGSVDIKLNDVHFYSIDKKRYIIKNISGINEKEKDQYEFFGRKLAEPYVNAAVLVEFIDSDFGAIKVIDKINEALDIIRCYVKSKIPLRVIQERYFIVDKKGTEIGLSSSVDQNQGYWKQIYSFNLSELFHGKSSKLFFKKLNKKFSYGTDEFGKKIYSALHWYKKGFESGKIEDKLLNYWIAIESLLILEDLEKNKILKNTKRDTKINVILELLPPFEINEFVYGVSRKLFEYLNQLALSGQGLPPVPILTISKNTLKKCNIGLNTKRRINLKEFVKAIPDLEKEEEKLLIKDKLNFVKNFYSDNNFVNDVIKKEIRLVKEDILMIYRQRNLIVHNAHYDKKILVYYVLKAENYANDLIRFLLTDYVSESYTHSVEAIFSRKIKLDRLLNKLENNEPVDIWSY